MRITLTRYLNHDRMFVYERMEGSDQMAKGGPIASLRSLSYKSQEFVKQELKQHKIPVNINHLNIFYCLSRSKGDGVLFSDLLLETNHAKSSLSDILDRYEKMGLIVRSGCDSDKRRVRIFLTAESEGYTEIFDQIGDEAVRRMTSDFTDVERGMFSSLLMRADTNI